MLLTRSTQRCRYLHICKLSDTAECPDVPSGCLAFIIEYDKSNKEEAENPEKE